MQIQVFPCKLNAWGRIKVLLTGRLFLVIKNDGQQIKFDLDTNPPTPSSFILPSLHPPSPQLAEDPDEAVRAI